MFKKPSTPFLAFIQISSLVVYLIMLAVFFSFVAPGIGKDNTASEFYAPIVMLLLFIVSAVVSASLVLGKAAILFWDKKYADSFRIVLWDVIWGFVYITIFLVCSFFA